MTKYVNVNEMPLDIRALQIEVAKGLGYNYFFEKGARKPNWSEYNAPTPKRNGYTARLFGYCTGSSGWAEIKLRRTDSYSNSARLKDGEFDCPAAGNTTGSPRIIKMNPRVYVKAGEFFSLAARIEDNKFVTTFLNRTQGHREDIGSVTDDGETLYVHFKAEGYKLLSLHITVEVGNERTKHWYAHLYFGPMWFPVNTTAIYVVVPWVTNPPDVYIDFEGIGPVYFSNKVEAGQRLTIIIRLATNGYLITNDFDSEKPSAFVASGNPHEYKTTFKEKIDLYRVETIVPSFT